MKNHIKTQNAIVLACAVGAILSTVYANTHLLDKSKICTSTKRERCYGVSQKGQNDCATAKHSCAAQSVKSNDPEEWVMVPKGLCNKLAKITYEK